MSSSSDVVFGVSSATADVEKDVRASGINNLPCRLENEEETSNTFQIKHAEYAHSFQIDRSHIKAIDKDDQADELKSLEVSVYDQDEFEKGIIDQFDKALEEEKNNELRKLFDVQLKALQEDIRVTEDKLKNKESLLLNLPIEGYVSRVNEALVLRREIDGLLAKVQGLKEKEQSLLHQRDHLNVENHSEDLWLKDVSENCGPAPVFGYESEEKLKQNGETERQRMIRLGQMTPFGTKLSSNAFKTYDKEDSTSQLKVYPVEKNKYCDFNPKISSENCSYQTVNPAVSGPSGLNSLKISKMKMGEENKGEISILRQRLLQPKKKRRKEPLGTEISYELSDRRAEPALQLSETNTINLDSSGSEYLPSKDEESSEDEKSVKRPSKMKSKKRKRKKDDECSWGTDDSDWEYSDEESIRRRRKRSKKVIDDGNIEDYIDRLKLWEKQQKEENREEGSNSNDNFFHELDGGLKVPLRIWKKLFSYQRVGVQWMWELHQQKCGGILGDEMGLGKTIQIIAFFAALANSPNVNRYHGWKGGLGPSLIACPTTMLHQWVEEFHDWWPPLRIAILHDSGSFSGKGGKAALLKSIYSNSGILVTSYEGLSRMVDNLSLLDWHMVVLDEGHVIRNPDARVTLAAKRLRTPHRLLLSGSPLQNNLRELWSLFDFIYPGKLGTLPVFTAEFAIPITQGGYATASQVQVVTGYKCATVLKDTISPYLLRRMKADVKEHINLPNKNEQVLFCRLTDIQKDIYKEYIKSGDVDRILTGNLKIFVGLINLRKICNHPDLYSGGPKLLKGENEENLQEEERYGHWKKAGKMIVIENLLRIWYRQNHRVLLFTQGKQMMCILENFVRQQGYSYLKLDGSTSISSRQPLINEFNQNSSLFIFLLTTKVGGLGVNLTGANRVVIYDPDWNPATDVQAKERAWRPGQMRHVTIYRLVTAGTIEEKIYHRQIFKQFLSDRVLRDPRRRRFFKSNDLYELFTLQEEGDDLGERGAKTETSAIFAGTGSEIKMSAMTTKSKKKLSKKELMEKVEKSSEKNESRKTAKKEINVINKRKNSFDKVASSSVNAPSSDSTASVVLEDRVSDESTVMFSREKIEMMKKMAQNLSLKIGKKLEQEGSKENDSKKIKEKEKQVKKEKRKKKSKEIKFEGERVAHLVGCEQAKGNQQQNEEKVNTDQDNYVLRKLFAKSGLQTALHHDVIMEGGDADYALVEGEAERVAHEAVKALKESRRKCWAAREGIPTWTGQSGVLGGSTSKPLRFGKKKLSSSWFGSNSSKTSEKQETTLSSSEILSQIRKKESLLDYFRWKKRVKEMRENGEEGDIEETSLSSSGVSREQADLLDDIRMFVACGATQDGQAATKEILARFQDRLPSGTTPQLFKSLLKSVCNFELGENTGSGIWKLKLEFRD